jgi:hypothetical protein
VAGNDGESYSRHRYVLNDGTAVSTAHRARARQVVGSWRQRVIYDGCLVDSRGSAIQVLRHVRERNWRLRIVPEGIQHGVPAAEAGAKYAYASDRLAVVLCPLPGDGLPRSGDRGLVRLIATVFETGLQDRENRSSRAVRQSANRLAVRARGRRYEVTHRSGESLRVPWGCRFERPRVGPTSGSTALPAV